MFLYNDMPRISDASIEVLVEYAPQKVENNQINPDLPHCTAS